MGYAIELYLSAEHATRVVALWERLADAGITSLMLDMGSRPHVSLAVLDALDPTSLRPHLGRFAQATPPLSLTLSHAGTFPTDEGVVFLAPVVTEALLALHDRCHEMLTANGSTSLAYYRPGHWVPHCTVGMNVPLDQIGAAVELCRESAALGPIEIDAVGLVEFRPVRELYAFPLGNMN